jgi:hypothetical protein
LIPSQTDIVLPIEVWVNIASFVAGANDFPELAALCATSYKMKTEITPILYETVIWNDSFQKRLHESPNGLEAPELRHVKYVLPEMLFPD